MDAGHDVLEIFAAPVAVDRCREGAAVPGAAAGIGEDDRVPVRGEQLKLEEEAPAVHRHGPAMDLEDSRRKMTSSLLCVREGVRPDDPALNVPAIRPFERELLLGGQLNFAKQGRIQFAKAGLPATGPVLKKEVARRRWVGGGQRGAGPLAGHSPGGDTARAPPDAGRRPT